MKKNAEFPFVIQAKNAKLIQSDVQNTPQNFFDLHVCTGFDQNFKDNRLILKMLPLELVYNQSTIQQIIDFFSIPQDEIFLYTDIQVPQQFSLYLECSK